MSAFTSWNTPRGPRADLRRRDSQLKWLHCDNCGKKVGKVAIIKGLGGVARCPECHQRMLARHAAEQHSWCPDRVNCECQCQACFPDAYAEVG